jgi:hypothetical protein
MSNFNVNPSEFDCILDEIDNLKTKVDDLINHYKLLRDKITANDTIIKNLEAKLPPKKEIVFVVCESYSAFKIHKFENSDKKEYRYVHGVETLKGVSNPTMLFVGNWLFRKDIQDIIIQSRMVSK